MVRGEYSELHVGYRFPTREILAPALAAFQKAMPSVKVLLHEFSCDEFIAGLRNATLELAIIFQPTGAQIAGIEFESLCTYPYYVALTAAHPFARLKSIPLEKIVAEPHIGLRHKNYRKYLNRIFAPTGVKPRIGIECDSTSSVFLEVEAGHGIALCTRLHRVAASKRMLYRPLTGATETLSVDIARAAQGGVTSAGEKFCEILRTTLDGAEAKRSSQTGHTSNGRAMRVPKPVDASVISRPSY